MLNFSIKAGFIIAVAFSMPMFAATGFNSTNISVVYVFRTVLLYSFIFLLSGITNGYFGTKARFKVLFNEFLNEYTLKKAQYLKDDLYEVLNSLDNKAKDNSKLDLLQYLSDGAIKSYIEYLLLFTIIAFTVISSARWISCRCQDSFYIVNEADSTYVMV